MARQDMVKEEIAYLKLWVGILVVTDISLLGWLMGEMDNLDVLRGSGGAIFVVAITLFIVSLHRRIDGRINSLGDL